MTMRPSKLLLRTRGACDFDTAHLLEVFGGQRERFVAVLQGFGSEDWAGPTRCAEWSAHDVVRHLCDCNTVECNMIGAGTNDDTLIIEAGFDPRITPRQWMAASAGEFPQVTLGRFAATSEELLGLVRAQLARRPSFDVRLPYGPMDWTVLLLHGFWDAWIHERDVLLARSAEQPTDDDATFYAAAYGVFIAAVIASLFGSPVQERLTLGSEGGGVFDLDSRDGTVTLNASRVTAVGPPAAQVTDALAGRSPVANALRELPSHSRAAMSYLADFLNTPVEQSPT
jgi:uncharacterized protein (TIGR03083 family)